MPTPNYAADEMANTHTIIARVPYKLHAALVAKSKLTGHSVATVVREALASKLGVLIGDTSRAAPKSNAIRPVRR